MPRNAKNLPRSCQEPLRSCREPSPQMETATFSLQFVFLKTSSQSTSAKLQNWWLAVAAPHGAFGLPIGGRAYGQMMEALFVFSTALCQTLKLQLGARHHHSVRCLAVMSAALYTCTVHVRGCRNATLPQCQHAALSECQNAGMPRCRNAGMLECQNAALSECPNVQMSECQK